jgi:soluble lytic murein transglycosylase-like protein
VARLSGFIAVALVLFASPAGAEVGRWAAFINEASGRFAIPEVWIRRVMKAESDGRTELRGLPIVSRAGAMGLMQLMPATWSEMRRANGLGGDPFDPHDNIIAGAAYLRAMYDRFGYPALFAAYDAGPRRYSDHLNKGIPLPIETVDYLRKTAVDGLSFSSKSLPSAARPNSVFAVVNSVRSGSRAAAPFIAAPSVFAIRR